MVQVAKASGMTVIGSAGGADKCALVTSLGADAVIDYKSDGPLVKKLMTALGEIGKDGIDVYFDNVGGEHLDAALATGNLHARFAICGMIDIYNSAKPTELRYLARLIGMRIRMTGLLVSDHIGHAAEFYRVMGGWLAEGKLHNSETVFDGLDTMPDAFLGLFTGSNTGKMLVKVCSPPPTPVIPATAGTQHQRSGVELQVKIVPIGVVALDEFDLPGAPPFLHGILARDGLADVVKRFGVDQPMDAIFLGKAFDQAFAMLEDALDEGRASRHPSRRA